MTPIIRKEIRDAVRNSWVVGYALALAVLGTAAAWVGLRSTGGMAIQMFGRTTATMTNLALMLAPLVALILGASSVAGERDRGTLHRLLSQPITPGELVKAKYLGLLIALTFATLVGFAPAAIVIAANAGANALLHFAVFPFITIALAAAMLAVGCLASVMADRLARALGTAIFAWFAFVLLYDLLLIGSLIVAALPDAVLAGLLVLNPVDAARVLVVLILEPDLFALGPAGIVLISHLGRLGTALTLVGALLAWTIVPLSCAVRYFRVSILGSATESGSTRITSDYVLIESPVRQAGQ